MIDDVKAPTKELSPFENKDLNVGLTFLHSVNLEISVLEEFENWIEEFPRATLYLYGTVKMWRSIIGINPRRMKLFDFYFHQNMD